MHKNFHSLMVFTYLFLFALTVNGQPPSVGERHASLDGLYVVTLPPGVEVGGGGPLEDEFTAGFGDGYSTYWNGPGLFLQAGYVNFNEDGTSPTTATKQKLLRAAVAKLKVLGKDYIGSRETSVTINNIPVSEISFRGAGKTTVHRLFTTRTSIVRITATYTSEEGKLGAAKFLDSIEAPTRKQLIAEKIREATPSPLPECEPNFTLAKDLLEHGLSGKVKSTVLERVEVEHGISKRSMLEEMEFDPRGRLTKRLEYEFGNPDSVSVYGCVDGRRVSKTGRPSYENVFTALGPEPLGAKPRDPRFTNAYELKMDEKGRITEILRYGNNEIVYETARYSYGDRTQEIVKTDVDGNIDKRILMTLDAKNRPVTMTQRWFRSDGTEWRNTYRFILFDANGNWTKRTGVYERFENGKIEDTSRYTGFRTITYYK